MAAPAKLISTSIGFQDPKGNVVSLGMLMLTLSQTATVTATGGQVTTEPIYLNLDANGKITSTAIWFQDELSPSGTIYYGTVYASNGCRMIPGLDKLQYSITGASFDLATAVQSGGASPSYSGAVLLAPTGNQTIATNNLTLATGSLALTAGSLTVGGTATITGATALGTASTTGLTNTGDTALSSGKVVKWNADSGISRVGAGILAVGNGTQGSTAGTLQVGTIQGATLTGATTGNNVSILNAQGAVGPQTGNATDQILYTYTLPANTIDTTSKSITITCGGVHNSGTNNPLLKVNINAVTAANISIGTGAGTSFTLQTEIIRTGATTGGAAGMVFAAAGNAFSVALTGLAWASTQVITITHNEASPDQITGILFTVKQNQ